MRLNTEALARLLGGEVHGPVVEVSGAGIDSRALERGHVFIALVANRDGHDFVAAARSAGASAVMVERTVDDGPSVVVNDTAQALTRWGTRARDRLRCPIVGITGSVGKTSVKDLTAAVLAQAGSVYASPGSFNNELGVPLTLVNAPEEVAALVVEMGARGPGHIESLCQVARPTIGIVTRVAEAHTEQFGSLDAIAAAKSELVRSLRDGGVAVLNLDDPMVAAMAEIVRADVQVLRYSVDRDDGEIRAIHVSLDDELRPRFVLCTPAGEVDVRLSVRGLHNVGNALAASAAGHAIGMSAEDIAEGLRHASLSAHRVNLLRTASGAMVLDDTYNANPTSMQAALRSLIELPASRYLAVLGTMAELGITSASAHEGVADLAAGLGVRVVAVAEPGYGSGAEHVATVDEAAAVIGAMREGDAVLVKGSRVAGLERLVAMLTSVP